VIQCDVLGMMKSNPQIFVDRLLVVMPSWLGDTVMATPALRALRSLYPEAHITALIRVAIRPIMEGCPWIDRIVTVRPRRHRSTDGRRVGHVALARRLAAGRFDTAVLLPNSFRSALLARMAGIPRRIGYDRDGRGFLLTDRLLPRRGKDGFVPVSTRDYYLGIARYMGSNNPDPTMALFTRPEQDAQANQILDQAGFTPDDRRPLVLISPGANYGDAKIWDSRRFAQVADRCVSELGAVVAISGAPHERPILDRVLAAVNEPVVDLSRLGVNLSLLKSVVRRSSLVITNDTGPRHVAAAFNVPVVTVFGPTDPAWTTIDFPAERQVRVDVFCGPCQKKKCPLRNTDDELCCMTGVSAAMVFEQASDLLQAERVPS